MNEIHTQNKLWKKMNEAIVDKFPNFLLNKNIYNPSNIVMASVCLTAGKKLAKYKFSACTLHDLCTHSTCKYCC